MKGKGIYRRSDDSVTIQKVSIRHWMVYSLLTVSLATSAAEAFAQSGQRDCGKVPARNWSVTFQPYSGPGHETSPYRIIFMNMEACNGYLYLGESRLVKDEIRARRRRGHSFYRAPVS